ncbi:MAG: hypothetical protein IPL08_16320 [Saprospiraceae bacterium]|nr:hypothetical protein [Saprospiraceae bacterium]
MYYPTAKILTEKPNLILKKSNRTKRKGKRQTYTFEQISADARSQMGVANEQVSEADHKKRLQNVHEVRAILGIPDGWVPTPSGPVLKVMTGAQQEEFELLKFKKGVITSRKSI